MPIKKTKKEIEQNVQPLMPNLDSIVDMSTFSPDFSEDFSTTGTSLTPSSLATQEPSEVQQSLEPFDDKPSKGKKALVFTAMEHQIIEAVVLGKTPKLVAKELGIPVASINRLLAKPDVTEHVQELITARNLAYKAYLPQLLMEIIEAKVQRIEDNPEATMADLATKKDVVDIAKVLSDVLKSTDKSEAKEEATGFQLIYQQIANIQGTR